MAMVMSESAGASSSFPPEDHEYDQAHLEEELRNNPLMGIADGVMGDIMTGQVCPRVAAGWLVARFSTAFHGGGGTTTKTKI